MIELLQPLADQPGVQLVMLVSQDGVPIAVCTSSHGAQSDDIEPSGSISGMGKDEALAAISGGWLNDLRLSVGPLSWEEPTRIVMRCARGVLVMRRTRGAVLLAMLSRGLSPEDIRLPMEGVVGRIERSLSGMGRGSSHSPENHQPTTQPPGPIPTSDPDRGEGLAQPTNTGKREDLSDK